MSSWNALLGAAAGLDDLPQALALLGEDFVLAAGLGFELGEDGGGLALGLDAPLGGLGLGFDLDLGLFGFGRGFHGGAAFGLDPLGLGQGGLGPGDGARPPARPPRPRPCAFRPV